MNLAHVTFGVVQLAVDAIQSNLSACVISPAWLTMVVLARKQSGMLHCTLRSRVQSDLIRR